MTQADQEGDDNSAVAAKRSWPVFKRLFASYVLPHWKVGLLAIMAMLAFGATQVGIIASVQPFLDDGLVERDTAVIRMFALVFLLLLVVQGIAYFFSHYLSGWLSRQLIKNLRLDAHSRLLNMPESAFDQFSSGRLVSKLTYQAEKTAGAVVKAIVTLFKDAVRVIGILGYMIYLSPWLMLIAGLVLPFVGGVIAYINKRFRKLSERIHGAVGGIGAIAEETVTANQEIKLFGQNERERKRFDSYNEKNRRQFMKFAATKFAAVPAIRLIISVALAIVIFLVTVDEIVEAISVGQIASFIVAMTMLNRPLRDLVKLNATMQNGLTAARSIFEIVDIKPEPDDGSKRIGRADGHIVFDQVKFSYDADREVLKGISFEAKPGQTVALTGPSGGGKSTLISLIPRFYEPTSGVIELDGVPLFEYKLADLRKQIALVDQNVTLFNTSVAENIAVGAVDDISREQVRRAAAAANALEFIENLPHGFDTQIGQDGVMLSGGQRQRLAIARAILKDAPILLLDEATSALDNESEYNVHAALERLMADRTSIVIAHRLSTVENADQILFLEDGEVVEQGSHSELLDREGRYAELYRMQYSENG
ncbi:lipid A export ATP-binding/permease protein MsbA [Halorhodospira halochloris]|uniref:Lipid A export ATP-binding/permease protein MsbA n=1 Tax=Halorhodospira halochloris TaxID=1052 RepID=A0A0X8X6N1_HALHR|nr:lipid A export permease/ATP-binding protein MsbA [Halorhodospira halochloris]BAU56570.1 lipid A export ATP-binding/permease protein MsbA [Halorhodospira halochloris]